jgi:CubicO group peptidase (beta-lactamase class C family)
MPHMHIDEIPAWLDERVGTGEFSGSVLVTRDGEQLLAHAAGLAHRGHGVPIRPDTRFATASITKLPMAVTALRLVERGVLDLHAPLVDVLPAEQRPVALTPAHTLHHLLSHTSGLANYYDDDDETWASWMAAWDEVPVSRARRPADLLPLFARRPAVAPPGDTYRYCDANFILAGLLVEAATGRPWDEVLAEEVLAPAGMTDTSIEPLDAEPARLATGYVMDDGPPEARRTNIYAITASPMPDGGMLSTTHDLTRLMDALLGGQLLGPELLAAMTRPQGPASDEPEQYGYGCLLTVADGEVVSIGHGGGDPGVATMLLHDLASRTTAVVLCNQDRGVWATWLAITGALGLREPRA